MPQLVPPLKIVGGAIFLLSFFSFQANSTAIGTATRINTVDIISNFSSLASPDPSTSSSASNSASISLASDFLPFFDDINNPVPGIKPSGSADVTPPPPTLNSFDKAVNNICGAPGTVVNPSSFQVMMRSNPTVLSNIKRFVGGFLISGRTSDADFLNDLTDIWFKAKGFDHVFCGEPVPGRSIGGMHFVGRYLELQQKGLGGRLPNNTSREEVIPGVIYTIGVIMKVGNGTARSPVKGYAYTLNAQEILSIASLAYKNNPNNNSTTKACHLTVTDQGKTFTTVFVTKNGAVRTFFPDATPGNNRRCKQ
ncbi:hypothetical protein NUACC21_25190 [Scytonema sp. NUACC21]